MEGQFQEDYSLFVSFVKSKDTVEAEIVKNLKIEKVEVSGGGKRIRLQIPVIKTYLNGFGGVFGGTMAAIVDSAATCLSMMLDKRVCKSLELNVTYIGVAKLGEVLTVDVFCPKAGKNILFTTVEVRSKGKVVAVGTNTKVFSDHSQWREVINRPKI